jgi:cytochrome c oxidase accessory protein FixG
MDPISAPPASHAAVGVEASDAKAVGSVAYRKLYKKREPIYPKAIDGPFRTTKWAFMSVLLAIYYITPWIRWDRGEGRVNQAVMVDFAHRRFYFGPLELWPQETLYIAGLLILAGLALFLFTSLFGRVWCGYACPQTVWVDLYLFVERRIEGDRNAQMRWAKAAWTPSKIGKKTSKHAIWLVIAAATGGAWIFYFGDAPTLARDIFTGRASPLTYISVSALTLTTYSLAGTLREQVCTYMCPWPRIQAAMMDQQSLTVSYRTDRGEPRGAHKKGATWEGRGDCVDCSQCVAVCPQGIDIRDGFQLECINCALCIDACDTVMDKIGRPRGLIGYDTDLNIARRKRGEAAAFAFVRPRTIIYAALIAIAAALMIYGLATRHTLQLNVIRDRNPAFVRMADGGVRNGYTLKILNMQAGARAVRITLEDAPRATLSAVGASHVDPRTVALTARSDAVTEVHLFVSLPPDALAAAPSAIAFTVSDGKTHVRRSSAFLTGLRGAEK